MTLRPVGGPPRELLDEMRGWWRGVGAGGALVVQTSGSTGRRRGVQLSQRALLASATASQRRLGGPATWVLALPTEFVAGLQVLVRSLLAGTEPVLLADHDGDFAAARRRAVATGAERCCTALVPTQLHRLAAAGRLGELAGYDAVLLGGAATDAGLVRAARSAGVAVVTTYGMAETCGGCVYDGEPLHTVAVRVDGAGRVHVSGPVLFDGYADDPAATADVLVDGWLRTDDLGRLDDAGRLQVLGRVDDVAVSGGVNVAMPAVEAALRSHRRVADVAVVGVADAEWGTRVVAVVQPHDPAQPPTLDDLRTHAAAALPRTWAPRALVSVAVLPLLDSGKVDRLAVRDVAGRAVGGST